jgi:hypothetical protein
MNLFQELKELARKESLNEISQQAMIQKAIDIATSMGGNMTGAVKRIEKIKRGLSKNKNVANALRLANEEVVSESAEMVIHADDAVQSNLVVKMASKHGLKSKKTKISWSGKDGVVVSGDSNKLKKFMSAVEKMSEGTVSEKFKPYLPKGSERVIDMYIQFRGNGEEKDFEKAKKMVMDYSKKHKLDIKDHPRNKVFGTPQEGSSAYKLSIYAKFTKDPNHDLAPLYKQLSTLKTAEDHGGGYAKPIKEETVSENYRTAARHGMGTEGKKEARVGLELDYYDKTGTKYMGKIVKKDSKGYTVKDDKTGKMHTFVYHDRVKAKKFLQKMGDNLGEKVEYAEYKFKNKNDAQKALDYFKSQQRIELDINDDGLSQGELAIDAGKKDMTKQHKEVLKKFKPKVLTTEMASAQQAAIAIAKKKKNESVMDAYREMWEEKLNEEVITYRVKGMQKPEMDKFKGASRMGLKVSFKKSGSDTHVTLTGTKKNLRDFDSIARGKSSYGDPSTIKHFDEK